MHESPDNGSSPSSAPRRLIEGLQSCSRRHTVLVPRAIDELILERAQLHLAAVYAQDQRKRLWTRWLGRAAAVLCISGLLALLVSQRMGKPDVLASADLDRNGQINILDAFSLARRIQRQEALPLTFDYNHDRVVDSLDVEILAARAVSLHEGNGS